MKIIGSGTWEHLGFQSVRFLIFNQAYDAGASRISAATRSITQRGSPLDHDLSRVLEKYGVPLASVRVLPLHPIRMSPRP